MSVPTIEMVHAIATPTNWLKSCLMVPGEESRQCLTRTGNRVINAELANNARQDRSERSARSVYAKGIQRVVIAKDVLHLYDHDRSRTRQQSARSTDAPIGVTKPAAGVIPTSPATAPEIPPSARGLAIAVPTRQPASR